MELLLGMLAGSVVLWGWLARHWLPRLLAFAAIIAIGFVGGAAFVTDRQEQAAAHQQQVAAAADAQAKNAICDKKCEEAIFGPPAADQPFRR